MKRTLKHNVRNDLKTTFKSKSETIFNKRGPWASRLHLSGLNGSASSNSSSPRWQEVCDTRRPRSVTEFYWSVLLYVLFAGTLADGVGGQSCSSSIHLCDEASERTRSPRSSSSHSFSLIHSSWSRLVVLWISTSASFDRLFIHRSVVPFRSLDLTRTARKAFLPH